MRGDNIALNDQLIALKSAKKVLQTKLTRVEEGKCRAMISTWSSTVIFAAIMFAREALNPLPELKTAEGRLNALIATNSEEIAKAQQTVRVLLLVESER